MMAKIQAVPAAPCEASADEAGVSFMLSP